MSEKKNYTVRLPIEVEGRIYHTGEQISLDDETAKAYQHSLTAQAEPLPVAQHEEN